MAFYREVNQWKFYYGTCMHSDGSHSRDRNIRNDNCCNSLTHCGLIGGHLLGEFYSWNI